MKDFKDINKLRAILQKQGYKIDTKADQEWYVLGELSMSFKALQDIIDEFNEVQE